MRRTLSPVIFLLCFTVSHAFAAKQNVVTDEILKKKFEKIELLENKFKLEEAQKAYEKIIEKYALTGQQLKRTQLRLEAVNIGMFFLQEKTPGSFIYTVKEGDRLFDLSKKFKTNMELIRKTNRLSQDELVKGTKLKVVKGNFRIEVDKSRNVLDLFFNKRKIKQYSVTTGANNKTPVGTYKIINKVENPTWYYEDKIIPAGSKKNRLGTRWMGINIASYGIHGTVEPEDIGKQASLGCVRMLNRDVEELYLLVPLETPVIIKN